MTTAVLSLPTEENKTSVLYQPGAGPVEAFDPADAVCKELMFAGHKDPFRWLTGIDPNAVDPDVDVNLRRFLVNRQLRMVLGSCDEIDTTVERYCLVDKGTDDAWVMLIKESVAPTMAKNNLPNLPPVVQQAQAPDAPSEASPT
jgi:hypothetical protein